MSKYVDALLGVAVGDAFGVPVEFLTRKSLEQNPVITMMGYGTHHQPIGTWSDDTSMTMCLAESLIDGYDSERIGKNFVAWYKQAKWTAHNEVFDIGHTTRESLENIIKGQSAESAGLIGENSQGNGSLMRILPLLFHIHDRSPSHRWDIVRRNSAITHGHINCAIACFIYLEVARCLLYGDDASTAYFTGIQRARSALMEIPKSVFDLVLSGSLRDVGEKDISGSGYVVHTLEASLWCILNTGSFKDALLKAVNLGEDTDTTGAVAGGLAGLLYSEDAIPPEWLQPLARRWDIVDIAERMEQKYGSSWKDR